MEENAKIQDGGDKTTDKPVDFNFKVDQTKKCFIIICNVWVNIV